MKNKRHCSPAAVIVYRSLFFFIRKPVSRTYSVQSLNIFDQLDENDPNTIMNLENNVLVIGFGRYSQIVCQTLFNSAELAFQ